jgi:hypothetical protein
LQALRARISLLVVILVKRLGAVPLGEDSQVAIPAAAFDGAM